jgi:rhomboid family GlyGly-CTERM serine protease
MNLTKQRSFIVQNDFVLGKHRPRARRGPPNRIAWNSLFIGGASRECARLASIFSKFTAFFRRQPETIFFVALILIFNAPVLFGGHCTSMTFHPEAVGNGQWWRLLTHPFVHLTWYHLLLDGTAFLSLYCSLFERRILVRLAYVAAAGAGSLVTSWVASPAISTNGLCGLSGIAHGLMAISAIEMLGGDRIERRIGWISLALVMGKAAFEAITGRMFFGFLDFGLLGNPVAVSHAGGILGGLVAMLVCREASGARDVLLP